MPTIETHKSVQELTMEVIAEYDAPVERVWQLWEDARKLERWWGPPTYPATFERHDFVVGGRSSYYMTGADGDQPHGWWTFEAIDAPHSLAFTDGFADENGEPTDVAPPTRMFVRLEDVGGKTRMTITAYFGSPEHLQLLSDMGMEEGLKEAMGQTEPLLRE